MSGGATTANLWTVDGADTLVLYVRGRLTNPPTQLYVSLEDASQNLATVTHPDPSFAKSVRWDSWKVPLSDFAGVNPAKVKKIYIGLGDKTTPVQGGAGLIYIDDICVIQNSVPTP